MAYIYNEVNWEDLPSTTTPRNSTTLGNMDTGIKENNNMLNGTTPAGNMIVDSIRSKNLLGLLNSFISSQNSGYDVNSNNAIDVFSSGAWCYAQVENFEVDINTNYTFSCSYVNTEAVNCGVIIYDANDNVLGFQTSSNLVEDVSITFSSTTPTVKIKFAVNHTSYSHTNFASYYNIQCEKGDVATPFIKYQNLNSMDSYSTREILIGYFLGKPLYRKVFKTTTPNSNSPTTIALLYNVDTLVKLNGVLSTSTQKIPLTFVYNTEQNSLYQEDDNIICRVTSSIYQNKSCIVIAEYTKTTD